nr:E3 ubiquitin-protein ligase At1g12760-like [Ipomoea batatas]
MVNKRFLNAGGERLPQDSPQLYWLWITFFAVDVFFVVIRVVVACIIGIAVCCYLPCIIAILYAVADQEGATGRIQANMSPEVPLNENLADFLSQAASLMPAFMDSALDTFPVGHSVLTGAADPGEVLALRVKDTLNAVKEGIDCWRWMQQISESVATVLGMQHAKTKSSFDLIGLITEKESSNYKRSDRVSENEITVC